MTALSNAFYRMLAPILRPLSAWLANPARKRQTWTYEFMAVGMILVVVTLLTTDWTSPRAIAFNLAGAVGVFFSFAHANVASRMTERQAIQEKPDVWCWYKAERYWLLKETAWFVAFMASGMYSALVGNVLFILFPVWRRIHVETRAAVRAAS